MEAEVRRREEEDDDDNNEDDRCPQAGQEAEEEALHLAKRRKVLCSEFAAITSSDSAIARRFLAGNDWHMEVGPGVASAAGGCPGGGLFPAICLCVSEGAERLFRAAAGEGGGGGGGRRGAAGRRGARQLVGDPRGWEGGG